MSTIRRTLSLWLLMGLVAGPALANSDLARQLVEELYTPPGVLPIKDLIMEGADNIVLESGGPANLVERAKGRIYYKFPNKLRADLVHNDPNSPLDGKMSVIIRDGEHTWIYISEGQYPVKQTADSKTPSMALPFNIQRYRIDSERQYHDLGTVQFEGRTIHKVRILNPAVKNWSATVWIDPGMRVPVQVVATIPDESDEVKTKKVIYRDFRKLPDGRHFPFQLETYEDDVLKTVKVYTGVKVNAGLDDSMFEPMKEFLR